MPKAPMVTVLCLAVIMLLSTIFCWHIMVAVVRVSLIFRNRELRLTMTIADILMYAIMFITIGVKAVSEAMVASMPNSI